MSKAASAKQKTEVEDAITLYFRTKDSKLYTLARTALLEILLSLDLEKGSKVLMTPINIYPMKEVIEHVGCTPIFVDIDPGHAFLPSLDDLEKQLRMKPACFLITHLFGMAGNIEEIAELCRRYDVILIEDISQSIGARYNGKHLGTFGDFAICSCSITKYLDAYGGGFALINDNHSNFASSSLNALEMRPPSRRRLTSSIFTTLAWNIALSLSFFSVFTYPVLRIVLRLDKKLYGRLLGAKIKEMGSDTLPSFYTEDISVLQARMIARGLERLDYIIRQRRECFDKFSEAYEAVHGCRYIIGTDIELEDISSYHVYWQVLLPVGKQDNARYQLLKLGIETGGTNLPVLGSESVSESWRIKNNMLFVPLHKGLGVNDYASIISAYKLLG
ncbi:aminotransferase class I/II-fold pyridoxal phosphate-dependent enzyme [Synechococcus sp. LTW-R]|nr:aminotransferase class I/II-fold pyridoxal phosphate-dependent enzyme [Synechococcus sp. LTW-R]